MFGEKYECTGGVSSETLLSDIGDLLASLPLESTATQLLAVVAIATLVLVVPRITRR